MIDKILFPGAAITFNWMDEGNNTHNFRLNAYAGNITLSPGQRYYLKIYFHAENFAGNQPPGKNYINMGINDNYDVSKGLKTIHIITTVSESNLSKDRLIVNLPQDPYHWSDSVAAYPSYDYIESNSGRTSMVWDFKNLIQNNININQRIITISYKLHEDEIKKDLENATFISLAYSNQSLEYARKADYWGEIALIIAIVSIPSAIWSSRDFIKWIIEKWNNRP